MCPQELERIYCYETITTIHLRNFSASQTKALCTFNSNFPSPAPWPWWPFYSACDFDHFRCFMSAESHCLSFSDWLSSWSTSHHSPMSQHASVRTAFRGMLSNVPVGKCCKLSVPCPSTDTWVVLTFFCSSKQCYLINMNVQVHVHRCANCLASDCDADPVTEIQHPLLRWEKGFPQRWAVLLVGGSPGMWSHVCSSSSPPLSWLSSIPVWCPLSSNMSLDGDCPSRRRLLYHQL